MAVAVVVGVTGVASTDSLADTATHAVYTGTGGWLRSAARRKRRSSLKRVMWRRAGEKTTGWKKTGLDSR